MEDYEKSFVIRMQGLTRRSEFESVVVYSLRRVMGESPSEVFEMTIGPRAMEDPVLFVSAVSKSFGAGARSVYLAIESYLDEALAAKRERLSREDPFSSLAAVIARSGNSSGGEYRSRVLHDPRVKDQFGLYASDAD